MADAVAEVARPARSLTLIVPGCKGARLDWLIEKVTELGVDRVVLAEFEHSAVHSGPQHVERLRRTAIAACKQSRRACLPAIEAGLPLAEALATVGGALAIAHLDAEAIWLAEWLRLPVARVPTVATVIGPEGGLSIGEVAQLRAAGGQMVRLAEHVLRIETAAVAVAANWAAQLTSEL